MILSIITINYNNAFGLQKTMESVLAQTSNDFEYIVVDGTTSRLASLLEERGTDRGTLRSFVQEEFETKEGFTSCKWRTSSAKGGVEGGFYSEPDSGIYNAMNKGIRMAKGEYVHFLNSGDWLVDEHVVENMLECLKNQEPRTKNQDKVSFFFDTGEFGRGVDILVGNKISVRGDRKIRKERNNPIVTGLTFYRSTIHHTSAYIRRSLFEKYGYYDETLRIVSDWKWYLVVAGLNKAEVFFTDIYVSYFDTSGISSTNLELDQAERRKVLEELIPAPILADYDLYHFEIDQMERIKRYPVLYRIFWFVERCLFKLDKWKMRYLDWKNQ